MNDLPKRSQCKCLCHTNFGYNPVGHVKCCTPDLVDKLVSLTEVIEVIENMNKQYSSADLIKALEKRFGVTND